MLSEQDQRRLDGERRAYQAWRSGDGRTPFTLWRREGYGVCKVLFHRWGSSAAFQLRYCLLWAIAKVPISWLKVALLRCMGVRIGKGVYMAPGIFIDAFYPHLIEIEDGAFLGVGCRLLTHEYAARFFRAGRVHIGRGSVVGGWSIVRCGVTIGSGVTVGAGSVV